MKRDHVALNLAQIEQVHLVNEKFSDITIKDNENYEEVYFVFNVI